MALYKTADVTLALDILRIWKAADRYGGVEPYVVPIFFKVDGERYLASLRIHHAQQPRPGSWEQPGDLVQLTVDSVETGTSPNADQPDIHEDNPYIVVPPGNLLGRGSFGAGDQVILRDISFNTTDLTPIPFRIDVGGEYVSAADALELLLAYEDEVGAALNVFAGRLNDLIADLFGLDRDFERCPDLDLGASNFVTTIDAQFRALIPGTIGGVFVCMENDAFDESLARTLRSSIREEVEYVINQTVNQLNLYNIKADPDRIRDERDSEALVTEDLTWPVIADVGVSIGMIVAAKLAGNVALGLYGLWTMFDWLAGGKDDPIGIATVQFDHATLGPAGSLLLKSAHIPDEGNPDNRWELSYTLKVNSYK